jgi:acyl-CoA synthetase (AMP-forming)/AMP-acid ligase II
MRSAGRALPGVEIAIVGADGQLLASGEPGEILVRSQSNMSGYWRRPDAEREALVGQSGWLRTGDIGTIDEAGFLFILDRKQDMIITGGENVYPAEVENLIAGHPDVSDVAVAGIADPRWGQAVTAFVVPRPGALLEAVEVMGFCRGQIAGYKIPKRVVFLDELPRNALGKVLRAELRARLTA